MTTTTATSSNRRRGRRTLAAVAAGAFALTGVGLAACGDDDTGDASAETLTKAEFVAQANQVCADAAEGPGEELNALTSADEPTAEQMAQAVDLMVSIGHDVSSGVRALDEPAELSDGVDAWLTAFDADTAALEAADPSAVFAAQQDPWATSNPLASEIGLTTCSGEG